MIWTHPKKLLKNIPNPPPPSRPRPLPRGPSYSLVAVIERFSDSPQDLRCLFLLLPNNRVPAKFSTYNYRGPVAAAPTTATKTWMDDHDEDLEIGMSSPSSSRKGTAAFLPPGDSYIDVEEGEDAEEYDDDDDDDYDYDDDDDDDENDGDGYDEKSGLACPFCSEDFDVLGLCCHIDVDHHKEVKAAICPVCVTKVETNMAVHLITQHETLLKILCKKKLRNGGSHPALSSFKKELRNEHLHTPPKGSSRVNSSPAVESDSLLLPFVYNPRLSPKIEIVGPPVDGSSLGSNTSDNNSESGDVKMSALPDKGEEKAQRCDFIRGLLFSTIFGDVL